MLNKPSAGKALKFFLTDVYNNLGKVILTNLAWTACFIPCLLIGIRARENLSPLTFLMVVASFLLTSPAMGGIFNLARKIVLNDPYVETGDFLEGVKKYWRRSLLLLAVSLIIPVLIGGAMIFYGEIARTHSAGIILWVLSLWALIFFLLMQIYLFPLMVTQKMTLSTILKTSLLLALNNIGFTMIVVLVEFILLFLFFLTGLIFIGGTTTIAILQINAFIELSRRYTGEEMKKERKREQRTAGQFFRETFFPWRYD